MSGKSSVGARGVCETGDQHNFNNDEVKGPQRFHEGNPNSHLAQDSKDQRSIANRVAAEEQREEEKGDPEAALSKEDPTLPAKVHGNEPSKGAKIDADLKAEEENYLKRKGKA